MKPFRIFIFFLAVLLLLLLMAVLFPQQGIGIGGDHRLSFVSIPHLKEEEATDSSSVNIDQLLAGSTVTDDPESDPGMDHFQGIGNQREEKTKIEAKGDAEEKKEKVAEKEAEQEAIAVEPRVIPANVDSLKLHVHRILLPTEGATLLYSFFRNLNKISSGENRHTRILHFGDSQIENDRMTALIRYRMQKHFGGTGIGLVQAIPLYSGSLSYQQEESDDWLRYTYFGRRDTSVAHKSYGIMGAFASVPSPRDDQWPMLYYRFNTARRSGQVQRIRLFIHSYVDSASVAFSVGDLYSDTISGLPDGFSVVNFHHFEEMKDVRINFNLPEGGRIYGISFESEGGVLVDNIAMRGASGLIFTSMNRRVQQSMLDNLSPGLILLQYGGNVVPYMQPGYYRRAFKKQLQFFKEACPGTPVIVIGPSDMSARENGHFNTYPGLEAIRDALRDAAIESGFGFWDLYEAMGGYNSMASFVHAEPPLASVDYVHFNNLGINLVAEMFYNALMVEFTEYESQQSGR
jgi:lysophospholipase L1-like esterase